MEKFDISSDVGIQVDYWSSVLQSFIICGSFNPDRKFFLPEDELIKRGDNQYIMVLRFFNCTGNLIDLTNSI